MHDDDKLELARKAVAKVSEEQGYHGTATATRNGKRDNCDSVQSALAAINALDSQLVEAVGLLRGIVDDYQSSEIHHPDHILISKDVFDRIFAFLDKVEGA